MSPENLYIFTSLHLLGLFQSIYQNCKHNLLHGDCPIRSVSQDKFSFLAIFLNRAPVFQTVLSEVEKCGSEYGFRKGKAGHGCVLLNPVFETRASNAPRELTSLTEMRCLIIQDHLKNLLEVQGYSVICSSDISQASTPNDSEDYAKSIKANVIAKAQKYIHTETSKTDSECDKEEDLPLSKSVNFDLRRTLLEKKFLTGKDGFDKTSTK